jgi:hypothetical protein
MAVLIPLTYLTKLGLINDPEYTELIVCLNLFQLGTLK